MKPNIGDLMKQAQQLQEQMQKAQEKLANIEVTGESGAGLVKVVMTGRHDVKRVTIDPSPAEGRQGNSRRSVGGGGERCRAPRRGKQSRHDVGVDAGIEYSAVSRCRFERPLSRGFGMKFSPLIDQLVQSLRCLPGVGPKSAQRMAFHLLRTQSRGRSAVSDNAANRADASRPLSPMPYVV